MFTMNGATNKLTSLVRCLFNKACFQIHPCRFHTEHIANCYHPGSLFRRGLFVLKSGGRTSDSVAHSWVFHAPFQISHKRHLLNAECEVILKISFARQQFPGTNGLWGSLTNTPKRIIFYFSFYVIEHMIID